MSEPGASLPADPAGADRGEARAPNEGGLEEPPPVLGRWSRLYLLVALELAAIILVLLWLTRRFV